MVTSHGHKSWSQVMVTRHGSKKGARGVAAMEAGVGWATGTVLVVSSNGGVDGGEGGGDVIPPSSRSLW